MSRPARSRPRHRGHRSGRPALAALVAVVAMLIGLSAAPAFGRYSAAVTNPSTDAPVLRGTAPYFQCADVLARDRSSALFQWSMSDAASTAATSPIADVSGTTSRNGTFSGTRTADAGTPLACPRDGGQATVFNGTSNLAYFPTKVTATNVFTLEAWFKTTTPTGKLIGFGNSMSGSSGSYDRHLYVNSSGGVTFGIYSSGARTVNSGTTTVTDGKWHYVAATLSTAGMALYLDGVTVKTDATYTAAETNTGYWRVGYDNTSGWPGNGTSNYFNGSLRYVAVYNATALTAAQISDHYTAGVNS